MFTNKEQINSLKKFLDANDPTVEHNKMMITMGLVKFRLIYYGYQFNGKVYKVIYKKYLN